VENLLHVVEREDKIWNLRQNDQGQFRENWIWIYLAQTEWQKKEKNRYSK